MKTERYLLDTHALIFWSLQEKVSTDFIDFFNRECAQGNVYISSVSIWEIALLKKKRKIEISDLHEWVKDLMVQSRVKVIKPTVFDMIDSTLLPDHHKDPFDRLLIAQAKNLNTKLVTRDEEIHKYEIETCWR